MTTQTQSTIINGVDTVAVRQLIQSAAEHPDQAVTRWGVTTVWKGGCRTDTKVSGYQIGGKRVAKDFTIRIDEPLELGGTNQFPNPQEVLMAAFNACMSVGYVAGAALHGVELTHLEIRTEGDIDLRGFLGVDASVKPGYETIRYTVRIAGNGTPEQFQKIHETVMATSPNRHNIGQPIKLEAALEVVE